MVVLFLFTEHIQFLAYTFSVLTYGQTIDPVFDCELCSVVRDRNGIIIVKKKGDRYAI
jgi:hypothetical protein